MAKGEKEMSLTVREKKAKILFDNVELFMIRESLTTHQFYDEHRREQIYKDYGIAISDDYIEKQTKLQEKIDHIFEASREWDFEGFEYR